MLISGRVALWHAHFSTSYDSMRYEYQRRNMPLCEDPRFPAMSCGSESTDPMYLKLVLPAIPTGKLQNNLIKPPRAP